MFYCDPLEETFTQVESKEERDLQDVLTFHRQRLKALEQRVNSMAR